MSLNREAAIFAAHAKIGRPYLLGAKWDVHNPNPSGPVDCSGFVRWCYNQGGILMLDGSYAQFALCEPCPEPLPGDLGFFRDPVTKQIDHVGMVFDNENMVEARGAPYNAVILRPRSKWEAWPHFTGYTRVVGA